MTTPNDPTLAVCKNCQRGGYLKNDSTQYGFHSNGILRCTAEDPNSTVFEAAPWGTEKPKWEVKIGDAMKEMEGKRANMALIPPQLLEILAEHYQSGADKYAPNNWLEGMDFSKIYNSMQRHAMAFWRGEEIDPETNSPHLAAVAWNALTLLWYTDHNPEHDDRAFKDPK